MAELEGPDRPITIARAAEIARISALTLRVAAESGRIYAAKLGTDWVTTRRHLHRYLKRYTRGTRTPFPKGYQVPEGEEP
jgi:hypothetical protein